MKKKRNLLIVIIIALSIAIACIIFLASSTNKNIISSNLHDEVRINKLDISIIDISYDGIDSTVKISITNSSKKTQKFSDINLIFKDKDNNQIGMINYNNPDNYIKPKSTIEINTSTDISLEEATIVEYELID